MLDNKTIQSTWRRIMFFVVLTFSLSVPFYYLIISSGLLMAKGGLYVLCLMWCPAVATATTCLVFRRNLRGLGWKPGKARYLLLGYALPLVTTAAVYGIVWLTGLGGFPNETTITVFNEQLGTDFRPGMAMLVHFALTATVTFALGGLIPALGEEIGWRGYLVPELAKVTSFTGVAVISGVIWTLYHVPIMLFGDYNAGAPPLYTLAMFAIGLMGLSIVLAWLRLKSGSVWPAVILHASYNTFLQSYFDRYTVHNDVTPYLVGEFGVLIALALVIVGFLFWLKRSAVPEIESEDHDAYSPSHTAVQAKSF